MSPHKVWNIFETIFYFISYLRNEMYCIGGNHCKAWSFLLSNATFFVTIPVVELRYCLNEVVCSIRKCTKSGRNRIIHCGIEWNNHLECRIDLAEWRNFFQCRLCCWTFVTFTSWPYHLLKAISQLLNSLWLQMR